MERAEGAVRATGGPLIDLRSGARCDSASWPARLACLALIVLVTAATFAPTRDNGFLQVGFDDAIVVDTIEIRDLSAGNLWAMATRFNHAHYVPLTMLSLAIDYRFWGLDPYGYHLTNIGLHALAAALFFAFLWRIMPSLGAATVAALIFAVHPLQLEAVTLAIQRKTVLSGVFFFATLIAYQAWRWRGRRAYYAAAVALFALGALAKPIVICLPLLLWLYEYTFIDGRLRWRDKLPFLAIAAACGLAALAAHAEVGAVRSWHGGDPLVHVVMIGRVTADYLAAIFVPIGLSPIYYYARARAFDPLNPLALAAVVVLAAWLLFRRRRVPWTFFAAAWFGLALLPESNIAPLAQLRADRFLYLPLAGAAIWIAVCLERLPRMVAAAELTPRLPARVAGAVVVAIFALITFTSAAVWRSDVSAWNRVAALHSWAPAAFLLLGHAQRDAGDLARAERAYARAVELKPDYADAHLGLARIYEARGEAQAADWHAQRFLQLAPDSPDGPALLAAMRRTAS